MDVLACLGCVKDNVLQGRRRITREPISPNNWLVEADAYVIGGAAGPFATTRSSKGNEINYATHAFLERWFFQFVHTSEGDLLWGKLGVAVGVGGYPSKTRSLPG